MAERAPETVVPLRNGPDPLESAGRSVLGLLEQAAGMAEKNIQHAVGVAQKLSQELQSTEQRIRELEEDVRYYKNKADRAEIMAAAYFNTDRAKVLRSNQREVRRKRRASSGNDLDQSAALLTADNS